MKTCSRCGEAKPATAEHFPAHKQKRDGLAPHCKPCIRAWDRARRPRTTPAREVPLTNAERKKRYRDRHPERVKAENATRDKANLRRWMNERYLNDPAFNMLVRLRVRTRKALLGKSKSVATRELIGCTTDELCAWIEKQFLPGMSWGNMSEWEIDHKRPLATFDLTDEAQLREAAHYTNLQPLWRVDNRKKGAKWL